MVGDNFWNVDDVIVMSPNVGHRRDSLNEIVLNLGMHKAHLYEKHFKAPTIECVECVRVLTEKCGGKSQHAIGKI